MKEYKKCPRCNARMYSTAEHCFNCKLNFKKFDLATNAEAKKAMANNEYDRVLYRKGVPIDVSRWKLAFMTVGGGLVGLHLFYIGRYRAGVAYLSMFLYVMMILMIEQFATNIAIWFNTFYSLAAILLVTLLVCWTRDIFNSIINKLKVPVSRPYNEDNEWKNKQ